MTRVGKMLLVLACLAGAAVGRPALAAPVAQEYLGLEVGGNLELAAGKSLAADGAVLIVHGSAAHHRMETIAALQENLKARGINSLAITLSLGLQKRSGMFDCKLEHDHRHADASDEIIFWVEWLQKKGAGRVYLLGHSRGGAQAALAVVERADIGVRGLIAAAPLYQTDAEIDARYAASFGTALQPLLAQARKRVEAGEGDTLLDVPGFLHCKAAKVTAAAFHDYYAPDPQHDILRLLGEITIPTLTVVAGADEVVPGLGAALAVAAQSQRLPENAVVTKIDGADHMFRDLFGDELADRVAEFVRRP
jgi:pimeloyl-ACP methyl ester carboxylesterase